MCFSGAIVSFTWVGKEAPPMPTMPASRILARASSFLQEKGSRGGIKSVSIEEMSVESASIIMQGTKELPVTRQFWIFFTLPETEE